MLHQQASDPNDFRPPGTAIRDMHHAVSSLLIIKPEQSELIVSVLDNYTLTCLSDAPAIWAYSKESNVYIDDYKHGDNYFLSLTIHNANDANVGSYYCREAEFIYNYVSIYVYVEDAEKLYVGQEDSIKGFGLQYFSLVVPCRPTSPNITVKLYEDTGSGKKTEVEVNKAQKDGSVWSYNNMKGFTLNSTRPQILYFCTFSRGHTVEIPVSIDLQTSPSINVGAYISPMDKSYYKEGGDMKLVCNIGVRYGVIPTFTWKHNKMELNTDKNHIILNNDPFLYKEDPFSSLVVHNISLKDDTGEYKCLINIGAERWEKTKTINIIRVTGEGSFLTFAIENDIYAETCIGTCESISWKLRVESFPEAKVKWFNNRGEEVFDDGKYNVAKLYQGFYLIIRNVPLEDRGLYTIIVNNTYAEENRTVFLNVEDKPTAQITNRNFYLRNEEERVRCKVKGYPKPEIRWKLKSCTDCEEQPINSIENGNYSTTFVSIAIVKSNQSAYIECSAKNKHGYDSDTVNYTVKDPEAPKLIYSNMKGLQQNLIYPNAHNLTCNYEGFPEPEITWYKDNQRINGDSRIKFYHDNQTLEFTYTEQSDEGEYRCHVRNKIGSDNQMASILFTNKTPINMAYIIVAVFAMLFLIFCIGIVVKVINKREFEKALRRAGLLNFEKGAIESINPDLAIHEQTNLLPYDREYWEISKQHIKLGQQLGAGAFGVVMKGVIHKHNRCSNYIETPVTVAIKMVSNIADDTHLRALVSELKIMAHLGRHLNIVNLIGAWTKHIVKRELYVIVEYCRYGNVHDYLLRNRENFINQIHSDTGKIDYNIGVNILNRQEELSTDMTCNQNPLEHNMPIQTTESTLINKEKEPVVSNYDNQPVCESTMGNAKLICTKDLLGWAYQVSRGMEYLVSRKILHGDLATRNILLADANIVKIGDFGLSKSLYQNEYKKNGDGPLPIKWMAVESIRDKIFTTQSDVWSFGIVLWEFFSLGETPYPGMEADERLLQMMSNGYRMDCPIYANKEIYDIMLNCWELKPLDRPSFGQLSVIFGNTLEQSVKEHYVNLNDPYMKMNTERFQSEEYDYLNMASPPDFRAASLPHNVEIKSDHGPSRQENGSTSTSSKTKSESMAAINTSELTTHNGTRSEFQSLAESIEIIPFMKQSESHL